MKKEKLVMNINHIIANELSVKLWQVDAAIKLIDEGNTIVTKFDSRRNASTFSLSVEVYFHTKLVQHLYLLSG